MALADKARKGATSAEAIIAEAKSRVVTGIAEFSGRIAPEGIVHHRLSIEPMPHQLVIAEAVQAGHTRLLIADDMGVGKTYSALLALDECDAYPALIVCPPALVINWERSCKTALPSRTVARIGGKTPTAVPDADIVIVPDSVVGDWALAPKDVLAKWEKTNRLLPRGQQRPMPTNILATHPWRGLVQDEAHRSKTPDALRTKGVTAIAKAMTPDAVVLCLTGTPLTNRPVELVPILNILGHLPRFGGSAKFKHRYCDPRPGFRGRMDFTGASNLRELNELLRRWVMIRRKRSEVITLPDFSRWLTPVTITGKFITDYKRAVRDLEEFLQEKRGDDEYNLNANAEALVLLGQLRQIAGLAKVETAVSCTSELLDNDEQVFLVTAHKEVAWRIRETLISEGVKPSEIVSVTGDDTQRQKQEAVDAFQSGRARVLIGNVVAVSEGLTLTSCANMITVELPWTPSALKQAEARIDRFTQTRKTSNNILLGAMDGDSSVDERLWGMLERKEAVIGTAVDGGSDALVSGSVANELLDSYR